MASGVSTTPSSRFGGRFKRAVYAPVATTRSVDDGDAAVLGEGKSRESVHSHGVLHLRETIHPRAAVLSSPPRIPRTKFCTRSEFFRVACAQRDAGVMKHC